MLVEEKTNRPTAPPPSAFRIRWLFSPSGLSQWLVRIAFASIIGASGLGALAFLQRGEWTSSGRIQVDVDAPLVAAQVAVQSQIILAGLCLVTEMGLCLLLWSGISWKWGQTLTPFAWGLLGGSIYFPLLESNPKEILLLSGAALVTFLAGVAYVVLWRGAMAAWMALPSLEAREDVPVSWLLTMILLTAAFLGGIKGWSEGTTAFRELWDYRTEHWSKPQPSPLDQPPAEDLHTL